MSTTQITTAKNTTRRKEAPSFNESVSPGRLTSTSTYHLSPVVKDLSASMLQHSSFATQFPKANRFPSLKTSKTEDSIHLPSTLGKKSTSFGFGHKILMSEIVMKNGWDVPAPNQYSPREWTMGDNKGKSFGVSYSSYRKVYNPFNNNVVPEVLSEFPGPGEYKAVIPIGKDSKKTTLKGKGKFFSEVARSAGPASNHYFPVMGLVEPSRYQGANFGVAGRPDFTKDAKQSPGPGSYKLPSKFDKYGQRRLLEEKLQERVGQLKWK